MSKAFTKESDDGDVDEVVPEPKDPLPPGVKNYVTTEGAEALHAELDRLENEVRPQLGPDGKGKNANAASFGTSLSPKVRVAALDRRIRFLRDRVSKMVLVDISSQDPDQVHFGATVTVRDPHGREKTYKIVGVDESDPSAGKVSFISPIARALMSAEEGDVVSLRLPQGETELEILSIDYS